MRTLWRRYGAGPGQLLATIASLAIATAAVIGWTQRPRDLESVLIWFVAAIVLHDVILLPIYTIADRITIGLLPQRAAVYLRVPALISLLVLAVVFPTVLGYGGRSAHNLTGIREHGYFVRWLVMTGALFALSGFAFALRRPVSTDR